MRVNPIIDWEYGQAHLAYCASYVLHTSYLLCTSYLLYTCAQVWELLRGWRLPFCSLYERGYTSLGKRSRTHRNLALRRSDGSFAPAWELRDGSLERAGREAAATDAPGADATDGPLEARRRRLTTTTTQ